MSSRSRAQICSLLCHEHHGQLLVALKHRLCLFTSRLTSRPLFVHNTARLQCQTDLAFIIVSVAKQGQLHVEVDRRLLSFSETVSLIRHIPSQQELTKLVLDLVEGI